MTTDPFETFDGAYVLGALSTADRQSFEAHLETCDACLHRVAAVREVPGLLALAPPTAWSGRSERRTAADGFESLMATLGQAPVSKTAPPAPQFPPNEPPPNEPRPDELLPNQLPTAEPPPAEPPLPADLLPNLLAGVARRRQRRRVFNRVAAGLVAACVIAVGGVTGFVLSDRQNSHPQASAVHSATVANAFFAAEVSVTAHGSWDQVNLSCTYKSQRVIVGNYLAVAKDAAGHTEVVASWPAIPGQTASAHTPTTFKAGQITSVSILNARGDILAQIAV